MRSTAHTHTAHLQSLYYIEQHWQLCAPHERDKCFYYRDEYAMCRAFRPLITIRFLRSIIKFQLPRNRIQQIFK
jgi:hypothetical protein